MTENELKLKVVALAKAQGWLVYHVTQAKHPNGGGRGWPDLSMARDGELLFIELKQEKANLEPAQELARAAIGRVYHVVRPSDLASGRVDELLGVIHHGDCIDVMAGMDPESIDAIVTDPPYGLEFMGKEWDKLDDRGKIKHDGPEERDGSTVFGRQRVSFYGSANRKCRACGHWEWSGTPCKCEKPDFETHQAPQARLMQEWHARWAEAAYRVAKPSAYLLAFGGTRTVHRMTVALEDAGWIIRDMLVWGYASGFPKSKASLKPAWEPIVMARKPGPLRMLAIDECRIPTTDVIEVVHAGRKGPENGGKYGNSGDYDSTVSPLGRWPANIVLSDSIFDGGIEGVVGGGETVSTVGIGQSNTPWLGGGAWSEANTYNDTGTYSRFFQIGGSSCDWCGASTVEPSSAQPSRPEGSAPSHVATSPDGVLVSTAEATGAPTTNGTETRSWLDGGESMPSIPRSKRPGTSPASGRPSRSAKSPNATSSGIDITTITEGRSTCATCAALITSAITSPSPEHRNYPWAYLIPKAARSDREPVLGGLPICGCDGEHCGDGPICGYVQRGAPLVSTHCLKCGKQKVNVPGSACSCEEPEWSARGVPQRPRRNIHPTVKPVDLMRHLVRLVTPTGGTVLDPFLGSGTTALAAEMEGFPWIGIEREAEYVAIAEARLNGTQRGLGLDSA